MIPARDAVLRLVTERALESSRRSVRVPVLRLDQLQDVERFRILVEGEACALAAERATAAEVAAIQQAAARVDKAHAGDRIDRFLIANQEFHFAVYRAAHSDLLQSMIETLWLQIGPYLGFLVDQKDLAQSIALVHHRELVAAIRARDPAAARTALAADLKDSTDVYAPYRSEPAAQRA